MLVTLQGFGKAWFTSVRISSHVFILDPFSVHGERSGRMVQLSMSLATFELSSTSEAEEESLMNKTGNPLCGLFENKRNVFKADELGLEIATIALPALLALASDPLASLVDAAFIGHIGRLPLIYYALRNFSDSRLSWLRSSGCIQRF